MSRTASENLDGLFKYRKKIRSTFLSSCRDAEDAVFGRNGYEFGNSKLRVEYPRSSGSKFSGPAGGGGGRGGGGGGGGRGEGRRFMPVVRRSEFQVIVTGELNV